MSEFLLTMQTGLEAFSTGGQYLALFLGSILFLWLIKPKENKEFQRVTLVLTVLILFAPTAFLLMKYRTDYYTYESLFFLIPIWILMSLGLTEAYELLKNRLPHTNRWKKWNSVIAAAGLIVLTALCGTVNPFWCRQEASNGFDKVAAAEKEVLEILSAGNQEEELCIWAPKTIVETARVYDGTVTLLYGRDMWNHALCGYTYDVYGEDEKILYDWMNTDWTQVEADSLETEFTPRQMFLLAKECGCNLVVLDRQQLAAEQIKQFFEEENQKSPLLTQIAETTEYGIYKILN